MTQEEIGDLACQAVSVFLQRGMYLYGMYSSWKKEDPESKLTKQWKREWDHWCDNCNVDVEKAEAIMSKLKEFEW